MRVRSDIQLGELWDTATSALINDRSCRRFAELDTGELVCGAAAACAACLRHIFRKYSLPSCAEASGWLLHKTFLIVRT